MDEGRVQTETPSDSREACEPPAVSAEEGRLSSLSGGDKAFLSSAATGAAGAEGVDGEDEAATVVDLCSQTSDETEAAVRDSDISNAGGVAEPSPSLAAVDGALASSKSPSKVKVPPSPSLCETDDKENAPPLPEKGPQGGVPSASRSQRSRAPRRSVLNKTSPKEAVALSAFERPVTRRATCGDTPKQAPASPAVAPRFAAQLAEVDAQIAALIQGGLPVVDTLENREVYIQFKKELQHAEPTDDEVPDEETSLGVGLHRLLRVLCEGCQKPLTEMATAAAAALRDSGPDGDAPVHRVEVQTLRAELPVLLVRKRLGLTRRVDFPCRGDAAAPSNAGAAATAAQHPRRAGVSTAAEDSAVFKLWVWECAALEGLPAAFKDAARREREKRQGVARKLRALERVREALLAGVDEDVRTAQTRLEELLAREAAEAERRLQAETKRRQTELARLERERERRQREQEKEEQRRQKAEEKAQREREKAEREREKAEREREKAEEKALREQLKQQRTTSVKKVDKEINRQQTLMASWLKRQMPVASPQQQLPVVALDGAQTSPTGPNAAAVAPDSADPASLQRDLSFGKETLTAAEAARASLRRAAETEASFWRVGPDEREAFVDALQELATTTKEPEAPSLLAAFVERFAAPDRLRVRNFARLCAEHRRFVHKVSVQQPGVQESSECGGGSSGYRQTASDVRQGLTLTDYCSESLPDAPHLRVAWLFLDDWKRPVRRLLMSKKPKLASCCEQWAEESCIDYERDSDEEWFECFDADDLEDAREEEEEEEIEGEDDRDWLDDDEDEKNRDKAAVALAMKFESFLGWQWSFDGEPKPNQTDGAPATLVAIPTLRDRNWSSVYGSVTDDWGGNPFSRLDAISASARRRWCDEDTINLLKFFHGKTVGKLRSIQEFQKINRHVTKAEVERQLKQFVVHERRGDDRIRRWWATDVAAKAFGIADDLSKILESIREEEKAVEARQHELTEQMKAQLVQNNVLKGTEGGDPPTALQAVSPKDVSDAPAASNQTESHGSIGIQRRQSSPDFIVEITDSDNEAPGEGTFMQRNEVKELNQKPRKRVRRESRRSVNQLLNEKSTACVERQNESKKQELEATTVASTEKDSSLTDVATSGPTSTAVAAHFAAPATEKQLSECTLENGAVSIAHGTVQRCDTTACTSSSEFHASSPTNGVSDSSASSSPSGKNKETDDRPDPPRNSVLGLAEKLDTEGKKDVISLTAQASDDENNIEAVPGKRCRTREDADEGVGQERPADISSKRIKRRPSAMAGL